MNPVDMANVTDTLAALGRAPSASVKHASEIEDRFLTLLVSQLKNQDPLNPMENAELTSQLAQLSAVDGIQKIDQSIQALAGRFESMQTLQAASLIGRQVLIEGGNLDLYQGSARAAFELSDRVDQVSVSVVDAAGSELRRVDLGPQPAGLHQFGWDGVTDAGAPAANGRYQFRVSALVGGKTLEVPGLTFARVDAVASGVDGFALSLGGYGTVTLGQVKQII